MHFYNSSCRAHTCVLYSLKQWNYHRNNLLCTLWFNVAVRPYKKCEGSTKLPSIPGRQRLAHKSLCGDSFSFWRQMQPSYRTLWAAQAQPTSLSISNVHLKVRLVVVGECQGKNAKTQSSATFWMRWIMGDQHLLYNQKIIGVIVTDTFWLKSIMVRFRVGVFFKFHFKPVLKTGALITPFWLSVASAAFVQQRVFSRTSARLWLCWKCFHHSLTGHPQSWFCYCIC